MSKPYKAEFADIEKKIFELEQLMDDSRFTEIKLETKYGWKFNISHPERFKVFTKTGKIKKFVPDNASTEVVKND